MKGKRILSFVLSAAMVLGLFAGNPVNVKAAEVNLAQGKTATVSSYEDGTSYNADKLVDGDTSSASRWGTGQNKAAGEWAEVDLGAEMAVNKIKIHFERPDADQNILSYKVETCGADGVYTSVHQKDEKAKQVEEITFAEPKTVQKVKLTVLDADGGTMGWVNVGVSEIEVYGEEGQGGSGGEGETTPPVETPEDDGVNLALGKTATADSQETANFGASKAVDGDTESNSSRWGSAEDPSGGAHWIAVDLGETKTVKTVRIFWELRKATAYRIQVSNDGSEWTDAKVINDRPAALKDVITLDEAVEARHVRLYIDTFTPQNPDGNGSWPTVSIFEMEVYSGGVPKEPVSPIEGITVEAPEEGDTKLVVTIPEEAGYTAKYNGTDFEQIVGDDLTIAQPLVDTTVKVSFKVTNNTSGRYEFKEVPVVVPGTYSATVEGKNAKPNIIPEIQEWYSDSTDKLAIDAVTKVVYSNAALETVVDEFIADYEDFTGIKLTKKQGAAEAGAFNFVLEAPDALLGEEGYTMDIQSDRIIVKSESTTGNMYGMQTILQMYKQDAEGFAVGQMRDYPKFEVRGLLLDVARKPISMEMIGYISRSMRYYKMNDIQIHLSDNHIFLEDYMENRNDDQMKAFQAYEAFRLESDVRNDEGVSPTAEDYYFTKEEFKEYIQAQRAMGMNVVPEIDLPAHSNSFTKVWPELMVVNGWTQTKRPLIDHLDISKPEAVEKAKEIFDDYTKGENPTFDSETTVHAGADEFVSNYSAYRSYFNTIVPHIKETNQVRIWGGLTMITGKPDIIPEAIEGVQMNLWSAGWASGPEMYDMGFDLINTIDSYGYMVPNGGMGRGAYGDLLNVNSVFNNFQPNTVHGGGNLTIPAGDPQVKGSAFAIWSDNIDTRASGLSESDYFWRFFDALPFYAEKNWAATGKEKGSAANLTALAEEQGIGPCINPYYQEDKTGDAYESYDFANGLADSSENDRDLTAGKNAQVVDGALELAGGESYVTSPIDRLGNGNELSFDITLDKPAKAGDIIFETDAVYGTHDIRVMEDGKLGFTRELYNYYFDYELPVGKTVNIKIVAKQQDTTLYVNDEFIGEATGKFIHNDTVKKSGITHSTFALPVERIGSKTNAIEAKIDNVVAVSSEEAVDMYNKAAWTGTTDTETIYTDTEGELRFAFDNNAGTIWHSNWQGATDKLTGSNTFYAELNFGQKYMINQFSFTPRTGSDSGLVTKADLYVKANADDEWTLVAENATFAANRDKKTFTFEEQEVQFVKFVTKASNDGWVAVSEFDIANKPVVESEFVVYVEAEGNGTVAGGASVKEGTEVTVTATPAEGATFTGWFNAVTGEKVSEEAEYTFTVAGNTSLTAKFEGGGTVTPPACEHEATKVVGKVEATCTEDGYTGDTVCTKCNETIEEGKTVKKLGHDFPETWTVVTKPTTEKEGKEERQCTRCDVKEERTIAKLEEPECTHKETEIVGAKAATCTEKGYTGNKVCKECKTVLITGKSIAARGHDFPETWTVVKEATTEAEGLEERQCTRCDVKQQRAIDKLTQPGDGSGTEPDKEPDKEPDEPSAPSQPPQSQTPAAPATGDTANVISMVMMMGFAVLTFVSAYRRRNNF